MKSFAAFGVAALLAGCGAATTLPSNAPPGNPVRGWIAASAKKDDLVYASAYSFLYGSTIFILSYPSLSLVGATSLGGLGLCSDRKGNVYAATGGGDIDEYAHGGTSPIKTLSDPDGVYNYGCSVDPTTGNLAVTNLYGLSLGAGNVMIYTKGSGTPSVYTIPDFAYYYFCAYDGKGDLFVDGESSSNAFQIAELPHGAAQFQSLQLDASMGIPGGVQWNRHVLAVGDQGNANGNQIVYEFSIAGSSGTETGSTPLTGAGDVPQFWIAGRTLIAPDTLDYDVALYQYPGGGSAYASYSFGTERSGFGATLSLAPKKK